MGSCREQKSKIEKLIKNGRIPEAKEHLNEFKLKYRNNISGFSLEALLCILEADTHKAKAILLNSYNKKRIDYDILYELGWVEELLGNFSAAIKYYCEAKQKTNNQSLDGLTSTIEKLRLYRYPRARGMHATE
jgi:hypothetical protein